MTRNISQSKYNLESIDRMAAIIHALENAPDNAPEQTLDKIARHANLSDSTALRYLLSLSKHGFVERDEITGNYRLGLSFFRLGTLAIQQRDIASIAKPVIEKILTRFGEMTNLAMCEQNQVIIIHVNEGTNSLRKGARAGQIDSWHATSLGKALLGAMSPEASAQIIEKIDFSPFTPNTLVNEESLKRDLAATKNQGYAVDDEESVEGLRCVGVAVLDYSGAPRYALSVSGPKSRMSYTRIQEIGTCLIESSSALSARLGLDRK